ncbi:MULTISPECIES: NAD(P)H-binding protein [Actinomyces]|uniref:NAD(P)H-binding protein n=1 Tax=Actinomyces respiraculi TaxID=2744574 RepID=A0A7T0LKL6_9ACTO|nr:MULTISPECIES: NAD(P)H-binding protein [Actinomyces]QPL05357.1 NAD(P)H-binding protein [Actinomyces respiraculi]
MSRIVIVGGHGKVALLLAPLLVERGDDVISLIRDAAQADDVAATGAQPLVLSVEEAGVDELAAAFAGADAIVWSAGAAGKGGPQRTDAVDRQAAIRTMEAAERAGARRYVMVSFIGSHGRIPDDHPLRAYAVAKLAADRHLQATGLDWTILGPGVLTAEESSGRITVSRMGSDDGVGARLLTSRANVAAVAAAVLADDRTIHRVIPFFDGGTPIAEAVADVPVELADLDT